MNADGQTWLLKDQAGGETIALILSAKMNRFGDVVEVLVLT